MLLNINSKVNSEQIYIFWREEIGIIPSSLSPYHSFYTSKIFYLIWFLFYDFFIRDLNQMLVKIRLLKIFIFFSKLIFIPLCWQKYQQLIAHFLKF